MEYRVTSGNIIRGAREYTTYQRHADYLYIFDPYSFEFCVTSRTASVV